MARFERWLEVKRIFEEALDVEPAERPGFLDLACNDDPELRREVEALLVAPAVPTAALASLLGLPGRQEEPDYAEGDRIDHFTIVRRVDQGGMGVVYEALDTRNNDRRVAIKVLFSRAITLSQDKRLAGLSHPAIVTFHDSGATPEGLPYFVFEFIEGEPITSFADRRQLSVADRLQLFRKVCDAVAYAHQRGVIHCDLKPKNILVTATGELKLLDFGIAREVGAEGIVPGEPSAITLPFASPEQVGNEETTTLSDVYSLGVLLAVLLTGWLPYRRARTVTELRDAILHEPPRPPSETVSMGSEEVLRISSAAPTKSGAELARQLSGDLDAITVKALCKEPAERYQSVPDLAAEISRYLADLPVAVRGRSRLYRFSKLLKRRRGTAAITALFVLLVLAALGVWFHQYRETIRERDAAQQEALHAQELNDFLFRIFLVYSPQRRPGDAVTVREMLDQARSELTAHLNTQPQVQIQLLNTLGDLYQDLGVYDETEKCLRTALTLAKKQSPNDRFLATQSLTRLGILRKLQGRYSESEKLLRGSLLIREPRVSPTDPDLTDTIFQLASTLSKVGRYQEAYMLDRRALELRQKAPRRDEDKIAQSLNTVGVDLGYLNRFDEAEIDLRKALNMRERLLPPGHPLLANTRENLANILMHQGKYQDGIRMQESVLAARHKAYGTQSPEGAGGALNLGGFQLLAGDAPGAEATLRSALSEAQAALGAEHPFTIMAKMQLGRSLFLQGKFAEAEAMLQAVYSQALGHFGAQHFLVGAIVQARGQCAYRTKDYRSAEQDFRHAIEIFKVAQGYDSHDALSTSAQLGSTLVHLQRFADAEPLLLAYFARAVPQEKADSAERLALLYEAWGKGEKAAEYRRLLRRLPPSHAVVKP